MAARKNKLNRFKKNGFSLVEVLIAMFILVVVGVAFLITLNYALKANMLDKSHTTAESLARSQLEYEKGLAYWSAAPSWTFTYDFDGATLDTPPLWVASADYPKYSGYTVQVVANPVPLGNTTDDGIQILTVTVSKTIVIPNGTDWDVTITVSGYKAQRQG